ncbi:MAG TPA: hypothetical protein VJ752_23815 [Burkholderiaceae bacterium]|nr:hypothetical protein [Burkholderiaceae bacterium]
MWNPVAERNLPLLLRITGVATMGGAVLFLAPTLALNLIGMAVGDDTGRFFVRHWGMLVGCIGALMVYSAGRPALQMPVLCVATAEKLALVLMVVLGAGQPALAGLRPAAAFDLLCVLLYSAVLWRRAGARA